MRWLRRCVALLAVVPPLATACLGLGEVDESTPSDSGAGGSGAANVGDGAWPDAAGGAAGNDASVGGSGGTSDGGSGGSGATGGTGAAGGGGTGALGGSGGTGATGGSGGTGATGGSGGTGATGGSGGTGGATSWTVYTYNLLSGQWSTPVPLSAAWSGANAPPSSGIVAVTLLEHFDRLLVFADDGKYYLRADGVWLAPKPIATAWPALAGLTVRSVYHVASPPGATVGETVTFVANPTAVIYDYKSNDSVVWLDTVTMKDNPPPAAPQASGVALWDFEVREPSKHGTADYYYFYSAYSNGSFYRFDAAFNWVSWPMASSPFWLGKSGAPPTTGLVAAWFDEKISRVQIIGK